MAVTALQWGRDVSIPEIVGLALGEVVHRVASMGPGCFYPGNDTAGSTLYKLTWLQWGRDVSIPEIPASIPSPSGSPSFNGAGMFLSRKYGRLPRALQLPLWLQWGRDVSIPEIAPPPRPPTACGRFNGAGMFLSRKSRRIKPAARKLRRFNGAGMFLSRK